MYNTGYPTNKFTWNDKSGASSDVLYSTDTDGLCVPFQFIMAERGEPGAIYFGGAKELTPILGSATFDPSSKYFTPATQFLGTAMAGQGVEVMRLVDPAATKAAIGLFLEVTPKTLTQYQKSVAGVRLLDVDGHFIPKLSAGVGSPIVTELGVHIKWTARALTSLESYDSLVVSTSVNNGVTTTIYPIIAQEVDSVGSYGNRQGFSIYSTGTDDATVAAAIGSVLYRFAPIELPSDTSTTASYIPDNYGSSFNDVSFKNVAVYEGTSTNYAFKYVLGTNYTDVNGDNVLPYTVATYGANLATIGNAVLSVSPELGAIDPYLIDLISGQDLDGLYYDHVEVDAASSTVVNPSVVNYGKSGTDGEVSFTKLQELIRTWLSGNSHGEFSNMQQHPMTHFSDPGFTMPTKLLLFNMLDLRDNLKIDVSTQDVLLPPNTQAQDMSAGQTLQFRAAMHPESILNGVGCTRVGIYAHTGDLVNGNPYTGKVPFNLNRLIQRRDLDGGSYIKGSAGGFPNSQVTTLRSPNWVADAESTRKLAWGSAINVVMHASRTTIFYPSLRTVYPNDTSLLSDDEISDRIIYMFKIARRIWAKYAGVRKAKDQLYPLIEADIDNDCAVAFSGDNINVKSTVFQTAADANLGYAISVNLAVTGNMPMRQMNFNVEVARASA
jgi:hypothetical protein